MVDCFKVLSHSSKTRRVALFIELMFLSFQACPVQTHIINVVETRLITDVTQVVSSSSVIRVDYIIVLFVLAPLLVLLHLL